jgi:NAD(P)-dependent dehydrogenase (short-subunit alcohol dehydrogenase family)
MIHPAIAPGNVAVVTGAADGIGLAVARRLVREGMTVVMADRDGPRLEAARADIEPATLAYVCDVADPIAVGALAEFTRREAGTVSVLVNNAGRGGGGNALVNPDGWREVIAVNLMGVVHGVQEFVPAMVAGDGPGLVINTGSKQGVTAPPGDTAYNVSKAGVKSLTEGLAHTLREQTGTRVSAHLLVPGFTYTGMMARHFAEKPAAAWTPDQVVDVMLAGIARGDFYLWCEDNETTRAVDNRRVLWSAGDITENRPALSRWHPEWADRFATWMKGA